MRDGGDLNRVSSQILAAACKVHSALGPGLLETVYEACLEHELRKSGLTVVRQQALPVRVDGVLVGAGFRIDLLVNDRIIVEVKSVSQLTPRHRAQVMTYLKLSGREIGLLLNFNVCRMKQGGIRRLVHRYTGPRPSEGPDPAT